MPAVYTRKFDTPLYKGTATVHTGLFIDGEFVKSTGNETVDVINPVDGTIITKVTLGNAADIDVAVQAATKAYKTRWGLKVSGYDRGRLLAKLADIMEKNLEELSALEALDAGKQFLQAKMLEIPIAISCLRYFAGWADKNHGQTVEADDTRFTYTRHEPIGVCALITPWNFPATTLMLKVAAALACGNTIVCKPSELTPLSALKIAEYSIEAGFPPGVVNVVTGYGQTAGQALAEHRGVGEISFTGSTPVGRKLMEASAKTNLKRLMLELGGKNPAIVFDDANVEKALVDIARSTFHHSGQVCFAISRIYVQAGIYDRFIEGFVKIAESIKVGDGFQEGNEQGPLVSMAQLQRVLGYIESGKQEGATVLTGGSQLGKSGYFVKPTIFTDVTPDMRVVREEIFGPVAVVLKFQTEEEAIEMANDSDYGLEALVFSQNISRALRVAHAVESGSLHVNTGVGNRPGLSFGGWKQSGFGKEVGQHALEAYTAVKSVGVALD